MRPVYGRSPWIDRFPKSKVPSYPRHRGSLDAEVVVIGGGLTGCATAYAFAAAGIRVALFEADRIGRGASGRSAGWITAEPPASFLDVDAALGRKAARHAWQAWRKAAVDLAALARRLKLTCAMRPRSALSIAQTAEQVARLVREQKSRSAAGVGAVPVPTRGLASVAGFAAAAGFTSRDNATVDPYRLTLGLASAAVKRGATIFERSPATKTAFSRDEGQVTVGGGSVRASRVIVATGADTSLFKPLARHFTARIGYFALTEPIPAKLRNALGARDHLLRDSSEPAHQIAWVDDERLLIGGADTGLLPARSSDAVLVQRTGQLMYELSTFHPDISGIQPSFGWDAAYLSSATGLPIIGPHRNYPHHLFALRASRDSLTGAYLASRTLLGQHLGEFHPAADVFGFPR